MGQLEQRLQQRFPHWFRGRRAAIARPVVRGIARWSRLDLIEEFVASHRQTLGLDFVAAALQFLTVTHFGTLQEQVGDWLYHRILGGNRLLSRVRRRLGLRYWSLAEFLKRRSAAAECHIQRFVQACLDDARRRGLDGIVCGHIHRAALVLHDELVYANDGDWVESLSALVEEADGTLRLLSHRGEILRELPPRVRQADIPRSLPQAA